MHDHDQRFDSTNAIVRMRLDLGTSAVMAILQMARANYRWDHELDSDRAACTVDSLVHVCDTRPAVVHAVLAVLSSCRHTRRDFSLLTPPLP